MGRARKSFARSTPSCPVDPEFFKRAEGALGKALGENARSLIKYNILRHNSSASSLVHDRRSGRPSDFGVHLLVDSLLEVLEAEVGMVVRVSKRPGKDPFGRPTGMPGPIPAFLMVIWDALEHPDRDATGFARLSTNCSRELGQTSKERQGRRAKRREPREEYIKRLHDAWKS